MPVHANKSSIRSPRGSWGQASTSVASRRRACARAAAIRRDAIPRSRCSFATNTHAIAHAGRSSTGFMTRERSRPRYSARGASASHATGSRPSWAKRPGSAPDSTSLRIARWFASPFERSYSARVSRGVMHQHPPHAPRGPNNRSKVVPAVDRERMDREQRRALRRHDVQLNSERDQEASRYEWGRRHGGSPHRKRARSVQVACA